MSIDSVIIRPVRRKTAEVPKGIRLENDAPGGAHWGTGEILSGAHWVHAHLLRFLSSELGGHFEMEFNKVGHGDLNGRKAHGVRE